MHIIIIWGALKNLAIQAAPQQITTEFLSAGPRLQGLQVIQCTAGVEPLPGAGDFGTVKTQPCETSSHSPLNPLLLCPDDHSFIYSAVIYRTATIYSFGAGN